MSLYPTTGLQTARVNDLAGRVLVYINTPDLKETLEKIKATGGTVLMDGYDIPCVGKMAMFKDPTVNLVALLQPLQA